MTGSQVTHGDEWSSWVSTATALAVSFWPTLKENCETTLEIIGHYLCLRSLVDGVLALDSIQLLTSVVSPKSSIGEPSPVTRRDSGLCRASAVVCW